MEVKNGPQAQQKKDQGPKRMDADPGLQKRDPEQGKAPKDQTGMQEGKDPARDMYRAKGKDGRPVGAAGSDPNAWLQNLPPKLMEDALADTPDSVPGKYEDLVRRWRETVGRMSWK